MENTKKENYFVIMIAQNESVIDLVRKEDISDLLPVSLVEARLLIPHVS